MSRQVTLSTTGAGVSGAAINASQRGGQLFLNANADANGNYSITLPQGEWELRVEPQWGNNGQQVAVNWAYTGYGRIVTIGDSNQTGVNFQVVPATAVVTGKILLPNGSPLERGGIDVRSKDGVGVGTGVNPQDGSFTVRVPAGKYRIGVFSNDQSYTAPAMDPFTAEANTTTDLGTITLIQKTSHIKGRVTVKGTDTGVSGVRVNTWSPEGGGWGETTTDNNGNYDLLVGSGTWEVMVQPEPGSGYAFEAGPPTRVTIADNQTINGQNFVVLEANATIKGRVVGSDGNLLTSFFAFAEAMEGDGDPPKPGPGTEVQGGVFTLQVPAGTWTVNVHTEPGSNYSSAGAQTVTVGENQSVNVTITMKQNDAFITGTVKDDEGNPVTGVRAEVFAENGRGSFKMALVDEDSGTYRMGVIGGDSWFMGVFVEPNSGYMMLPPTDSKTEVTSGETVTKNFTLLKANAVISGKVLDPEGNGLSNVFVFADTNLVEDGSVLGLRTEGAPANAGGPMGGPGGDGLRQGINTGDLTSSDGSFRLEVPAGTYGLGSGAPSSLGYINPEFKRVDVAKDQEVTGVTLQYRESDAQISGSVLLNGEKSEGFVWAWSESGAHSETFTRTGDFTLNVTSDDVWHIGADWDIEQKFYRSQEYVIDMTGSTTATQDLVLLESDFTVPPAVSQSISAASGGTIQLEDGTRLIIPAGAFGSSGTYTVTITPTTQLTKEKNNRPLAFGYAINAVDSNGQEFTSNFNSNVRLVIPYTDGMLAAFGITEDEISAGYFDETSAVWQGVDSFTVNKDDNTIIASISHFTDFALVTGSADTTPPSNPTNVTATAGVEKITLTWSNPTDSDFDHVNVYRSTTSGQTGTLVASTTSSAVTSYEDTGLTGGTVYYYVLKAVDSTGNESTGTTQVSATPTASADLPATGTPLGVAIAFYLSKAMLITLLVMSGYLVVRKSTAL